MEAVAHEAQMNVVTEGMTQRQHLAVFAARPSGEWAATRMAPKHIPYYMQYLHEMHLELSAGLPEGFHGPGKASWEVIAAWRQNMNRGAVTPAEITALLRLDQIRRDPTSFTVIHIDDAPVRRGQRWPDKKKT